MQLSTKLANLIASGQDARSAIGNFKRLIYSGTMPVTADAHATQVSPGTSTSAPGPTPSASSAMASADEP